MIRIGKYKFPEKCPNDCPELGKPFYQGNLCMRCPIFSCTRTDDGICLVEPEYYREDWAAEFHKWMFDDNFEGYPNLTLYIKENKE